MAPKLLRRAIKRVSQANKGDSIFGTKLDHLEKRNDFIIPCYYIVSYAGEY
jgi:hypothetical protein